MKEKNETLLFEYATPNGGISVFRLPNNTVVEINTKGISDSVSKSPDSSHPKRFDDWESWWKNFSYSYSWISLLPLYIHEDVKPGIEKAVSEYKITDQLCSAHKNIWNYCIAIDTQDV